MFTASKWHFHFQDFFLSNQLLCFHIFFSNSWLMQHSSILWTTVCFCYKAMNYCLFKSSNILELLEHLMWPQKKLQCNQILTGLLYVTLLTVSIIFFIWISQCMSQRECELERDIRKTWRHSVLFPTASQASDTKKHDWCRYPLKTFKDQNSCNSKFIKQKR